jgi:hypothetical protein
MDIIGEFVRQLFWELNPIIDWALRNWAVTMLILVGLIYWAGRQRRLHRHHLEANPLVQSKQLLTALKDGLTRRILLR